MAQWSDLWKEYKGFREILLEQARFTPPSQAKPTKGGKFPHLQPFKRKAK